MRLPERKQPDTVIVHFGRNGERMTEKNVIEDSSDFRAAVASTAVV